jgi:hypothetical protein
LDLNQLYFEHQLSLMRASQAPAGALRLRHEFAASVTAGRVGCIQRAARAPAADGWEAMAKSDSVHLLDLSLAGPAARVTRGHKVPATGAVEHASRVAGDGSLDG